MIVKDRELPPGIVYLKTYRKPGARYKEDDEQMALFEWVERHAEEFPVLNELYHVANQGSGGRRGMLRQAKFKRMGLKPGIWDVCWDASMHDGRRASLRIEMKANSNNLEDPQIDKAWEYHRKGYAMYVCYTWLDAVVALVEHFGLDYAAIDGQCNRRVYS